MNPESWSFFFTGSSLTLVVVAIIYTLRHMRIVHFDSFESFKTVEAPLSDRMRALTLVNVELILQLSELQVGTALNIKQLEEAGLRPHYKPTPAHGTLQPPPQIQSPVARFHQLLAEKFNEPELDELAFEMGFTTGFNGDSMPARALALMKHADRRGMLAQLADRVEVLRPNVEGGWPNIVTLSDKR